MYKRLRIYYFYTALPFLLLIAGAGFFSEAIMRTLDGNPHPQINYAIFVVTLLGGALILRNVHTVMKEARLLDEFSLALKKGVGAEGLLEQTRNWDAEISYVLRMIAATVGSSLSHQEQAAIEHELHSAQSRLDSRHALPQFLTSLLVGLGLLGTFVGLLSALGDIGAMVASFGALDVNSADLIGVFRGMVQRMEAPMSSMAIAFSASMFGLLGSIILGFMMVAAKGCVRELYSLLGSEVSQHVNLALAETGPETLAGAVERMSDVLNTSISRMTRELEVNFSQLTSALGTIDHRVKLLLDAGGVEVDVNGLRDVLLRLDARLTESTALQDEVLRHEQSLAETQRKELESFATENRVLVDGMQQTFQATLQEIAGRMTEAQQAVLRNSQELAASLSGNTLSVRLSETPEGLDRLPEMLSKVSNAITLSASRIELASREIAEKGMGGGPRLIGAEGDGAVTVGGGASKEIMNEQVDLLRRIEERLADNYRTQAASLQAEFDNINRTRGEMTRVFNEHAESMSMLRSELQRIGRQLGIAHALMERSSTGLMDMLNERFAEQNNNAVQQGQNLSAVGDAMARIAEDSGQNLRLLGEIAERVRNPETRALITEVVSAIRQVSSLQIDLGIKIEQAQMDGSDQMREMIRAQKDAVKLLAAGQAAGTKA